MHPKKVKITPALFGLMEQYRLSTMRPGVEPRWQVGQVIGVRPNAGIEKYAHVLVGWTLPLAIGAFSYSHSAYHMNLKIGRYCSLSWQVEVIEGDHPMDWLTTSPVTHQPADIRGLGLYLNDVGERGYRLYPYTPSTAPVTLGNDVWVGSHVRIKRGVTVGDGAVIGAGSIVTRDVPPYAIVAGTPARVLRYRFPEPLIDRLLASAWWRYGPEKVQGLDPQDPTKFLDRFEAAVAKGLEPLDLPILTGAQIIAAGEEV